MSASTSRPSKVHRPGLAQAVSGVVPPEIAEANIRTVWPSVTEVSRPAANLGAALTRTRVLAPLAWLLMAPLYFKKILPFLAKRYRLTNRRLMVCRGIKAKPKQEIALADIDEVRIVEGSFHPFYKSADLEVVSGGQVKLRLPGVPEAEGFRQSILNALMAWVPGKSKALPMVPASAK
jgi:Bacterial PH domain